MDPLKATLDYIIDHKQIKTAFQPIISLKDGSILGHEALSRITYDSEIKNPEILFSVAEKNNRLWDLELLCRTTALEAAYSYIVPPNNKKLFLNVNPNIMHDESYKKGLTKALLKQYNITTNHIIFEITERNVISDMSGFKTTINHYKSQHFRIAIDDAGAGYSGLNLISDVNPNYIKLDMKLIRHIDQDSLKYALVKGMVEFSKVSNVKLIAEGIENCEELNTLIHLGVQYGQGYYIQKPDFEINEIDTHIIQTIKDTNRKKNRTRQSTIANYQIGNLSIPIGVVSPTELISNVYEVFRKNHEIFGLCVVEDHIPVGTLTRENVTDKLSGYYGYTLNQNKPVQQIMDREFLSVDYKTSVSDVSVLAMNRPNDKLYDFIVVTKDEKFVGIVSVKDLLMKTTDLKISAAKQENPLTGLLGNLMIEQKLDEIVSSKKSYTVAYLDIDHFKSYNDAYGFENGDLVIKLLADLLLEEIPSNQFIGHVGGDDFTVIMDEYVDQSYFDSVQRKFEREVLNLYTETDAKKGYITVTNRQGEIDRFPLISLTIVSVDNEKQSFNNALDLTKELARLKSIRKQARQPIG